MEPIDLIEIQLVVDRLAAQATMLREVGAAADLAAVVKAGALRASPSAFVLLESAVPQAVDEGSGPLRQTFDVTVAVILAVDLSGFRGEAGVTALAGPQAAIRAAMFGWAMPGTWRRFWFGPEGLEDFNDQTGVLLYRHNFNCQVRIQEG